MTIRDQVQQAIKEAMKAKDHARLETLRMAKGALLLKEKEGAGEGPLDDETATATLRAEVRKRQQSIATYEEHGQADTVAQLHAEIAVLESFLPKQLDEAALEAKVREFLAAHPEINHAGKLTGALKQELGDLADGKMLNAVCRKALENTP